MREQRRGLEPAEGKKKGLGTVMKVLRTWMSGTAAARPRARWPSMRPSPSPSHSDLPAGNVHHSGARSRPAVCLTPHKWCARIVEETPMSAIVVAAALCCGRCGVQQGKNQCCLTNMPWSACQWRGFGPQRQAGRERSRTASHRLPVPEPGLQHEQVLYAVQEKAHAGKS